MLLFIFLAFSGAIQLLQTFLVEIIRRRIFVRVAADLAYRLPRVRCEVYDHSHGAELVNRFFDVLTVQKAGATLLLEGVAIPVRFVRPSTGRCSAFMPAVPHRDVGGPVSDAATHLLAPPLDLRG